MINLIGKRLLIIDDDLPVRQSFAFQLRDAGFVVLEQSSPVQAMAELHVAELPDLVLLNLQVSNSSGIEVLQDLHSQFPLLSVVVASSLNNADEIVQVLRLGAKDYLVKPIADVQTVVDSISRVLNQRELERINLRYHDQLRAANTQLQDNLDELERDHLAGRRVQKRMMPTGLTTPDGFSVQHRILPSLYLSGDFIDYGLLADRYLVFYLADVSGHGASSAFVTVWLKFVVGRMVREEGLFSRPEHFDTDPNRMLQQINFELQDTKLGHHLTFFVGVIDTKTLEMRYVVAGHLPLPILKTANNCIYLEGKGKPVGIFKSVEWKVHKVHLPEKFSLVCFSDGILETFAKVTLQEKELILRQAVANSSGTLDSISKTLSIKEQDRPDDIAVLTVTRGLL